MDYEQHLVTTLVCFVKAEGWKGASVRGALVLGDFCPGGIVRGALMAYVKNLCEVCETDRAISSVV